MVGPRDSDIVENDLARSEFRHPEVNVEDFHLDREQPHNDHHDRPDNEKYDTEKPEEMKGKKRRRKRRRRVPVFTVEVLSSKTEMEVRARNKVGNSTW